MTPKGKPIKKWKAHKHRTVRCRVRGKMREYNRITCLEVYRYIKEENAKQFIEVLHSLFTFIDPKSVTLPKVASDVMRLNGKCTVFEGKQGKRRTKVIYPKDLKKYVLLPDKVIYMHHCFLVKRRRNLYVIRIYKAILQGSKHFKVEIAYYGNASKLPNLGPKENDRKNEEKVDAMLEMMDRIDEVFPHFKVLDFTSSSVNISTIKRRSKHYKPETQKQREAEERRATRYHYWFDYDPITKRCLLLPKPKTYGEDS